MGSTKQNRHIARLIVGAMSIDGELDRKEREKVARTLTKMGMGELIADVGAALEDYDGNFNMFEECKELMAVLGNDAKVLIPTVFRIIVDVIASDRFVSVQEASYLSALAKRLKLSVPEARLVLKSVMAERRGRLEVAASNVDELIHPALKELLNFEGAEDLVGAVDKDSIEELMHNATEAMHEGEQVCYDDVARALTILGLSTNAKLEDAKEIWQEAIEHLDLPKMVNQGETFVTAAINRITEINNAYKTVLHFHERLEATPSQNQAEKKSDLLEEI